MYQFKRSLTIEEISPFRFYWGIFLGVGYSVAFYALMRTAMRIANIGSTIDVYEPWYIYKYQFNSYDLQLISITAVSMGFCYTASFWMGNLNHKHKTKTLQLRMASVNALWMLYGTLFFLVKLNNFLFNLDIQDNFGNLPFLIPLMLYLYAWSRIRRVYQCMKFFFITTVLILLTAFLLSLY